MVSGKCLEEIRLPGFGALGFDKKERPLDPAAVRVMGWLPTAVSALSPGDLFPVSGDYSSGTHTTDGADAPSAWF
jgi:hypothetical protein